LLILLAELDEIMVVKDTLVKFSKWSGLKINFSKYQMLPINVDEDVLKQLAEEFGCQVGTMSFTYLGLPLGTTRPTIAGAPEVRQRHVPGLVQQARLPLVEVPVAKTVHLVAGLYLGGLGELWHGGDEEETRRMLCGEDAQQWQGCLHRPIETYNMYFPII
jgi:hypothetical protein